MKTLTKRVRAKKVHHSNSCYRQLHKYKVIDREKREYLLLKKDYEELIYKNAPTIKFAHDFVISKLGEEGE